MSILFHKKSRKVVRVLFAILAVLVTFSMLALYAPGIFTMF